MNTNIDVEAKSKELLQQYVRKLRLENRQLKVRIKELEQENAYLQCEVMVASRRRRYEQ